MSYKNISVTLPVYERLKKLKQPGESFSEVLWRELPQALETFGEIEAHFDGKGVLEGRGRRSNRR